jgi:hypothetical protein
MLDFCFINGQRGFFKMNEFLLFAIKTLSNN